MKTSVATNLTLCMGCQFLVDAGLYESHEEAIKREEVLGRLDQVIYVDLKLSACSFSSC